MSSLCRLHVEVADSLLLSDSRILRIGEWAGSAIAQAGQIVLVPAEVLAVCLGSEGAVLIVDDLPHYVVDYHSALVRMITIS